VVVNTADGAIAATLRGVGITRLLSYQVADLLVSGALKRLLVEYEPEAVPVSLLYARQGRLPAKTRAFLELAVTRLTSALGVPPN
jgi:DNA-binding transcriptional LysR family regulator